MACTASCTLLLYSLAPGGMIYALMCNTDKGTLALEA